MEQGLWTECVYCTMVNTEIGKDCPYCNGNFYYFQPAQMMDKSSSQQMILKSLTELKPIFDTYYSNEEDKNNAAYLKKMLLGILKDVNIYNFDLKDALINYIRWLEEEMDTE